MSKFTQRAKAITATFKIWGVALVFGVGFAVLALAALATIRGAPVTLTLSPLF